MKRDVDRAREKHGWNRARTLMYCQADIVNALVPGYTPRPCTSLSLSPVRFRYRRYLSYPSSIGASLCAQRNTRGHS